MSVIRLAQQVRLPAEPSWWLSCVGLFNGLVVGLVECPLSAMLGTGSLRNFRKHGIFAMCSVDSTPVYIQNSFMLYTQHIHRLMITLHVFSNCVYKASFHGINFHKSCQCSKVLELKLGSGDVHL